MSDGRLFGALPEEQAATLQKAIDRRTGQTYPGPKWRSWRGSAYCIPVGHPEPELIHSDRHGDYTLHPRFDRPNPPHWPTTADLLIADYVCNLCCMAFHGLSPDRARRMALSEWPHVEYVDYEGRRFPAARCGGNGALIDLSVWPRRIWRMDDS